MKQIKNETIYLQIFIRYAWINSNNRFAEKLHLNTMEKIKNILTSDIILTNSCSQS